ncbi:MAG: AAA domain-containing protein [Anaerolineae bacterium]
MNPTPPHPPRLSVTSLTQYVRMENCERFLRFRLHPDEEAEMRKRWHLTIQPLTPLLKDSGAEFEREAGGALAARGEPVINLEGQPASGTLNELACVREPVILLQPSLEGMIGQYWCHGRADVIRVQRNKQGALDLLIADIKASRHERMEHRLQVAIYARLIQEMAAKHGLTLKRITGTVLSIAEDGGAPALDPDAPTFDLTTYLTIVEHLAVAPDSVVNRVARLPFQEVAYHLGYKCDGCLYNALCMYDSAERLDLSLVPTLSAVEKRVLRANGVTRLPELANLMQLPAKESADKALTVTPGQEATVARLHNQWPVGPNLPVLVQRARRALYRFDKSTAASTILYGGGFGALPSDEEHPRLVKILFDAQHDYLQDRVYLISARVQGPKGVQELVRCTDAPPTDESERQLLLDWVMELIAAVAEVADGPSTPVHLYCYNRYDQKVLLEALKRRLDQVAGLPAFFDLMTQTPALTQPVISFLADELDARRNLGLVCTPLHDAARVLGFNWSDGTHEFYRLFRARLFDNRRDVLRLDNGQIAPAHQETPEDDPRRVTIEAASRFNSQVPLEYAYAAWGKLPPDMEDAALLVPFRAVTLDELKAFGIHRTRALAHIESSFKRKAQGIQKSDLDLPALVQAALEPPTLAQSLEEFLYMEHHAALQGMLLTYSLPIERRAQTGLALLLRYEETRRRGNIFRFAIDFNALGLDPVLTMNGFRLKEGDWVVFNPADPNLSASRLKHGRLATLHALGADWVDLELLDLKFRGSKFRYYHDTEIVPERGQRYTMDEMADDLNADKVLEALQQTGTNTLYRALLQPPALRPVPVTRAAALAEFAALVDTLEKQSKLTPRQRQVVAESLADPVLLVQGPPGTGKSHTLAWAVLARLAASAAEGQPYRVAVSCKTHNAVHIVLGAIADKWNKLTAFATPLTRGLIGLQVYKLGGENSEAPPKGVQLLDYYTQRDSLDAILTQRVVVIGGTPGGLYSLAKYRGAGGRGIDWNSKPFDLLVMDEASQMSLPEGILASAFLKPDGAAIVVGDHRQMPPIIAHAWDDEHRRTATANRPYLSLFESLLERDFPRVGLDESFRLHTTIAEFLEENIYRHDGIPFFSRRREELPLSPATDPFVARALDPHYPLVVIEHGERASQQYNRTEIELIAPLIDLCAHALRLDGKEGIGVVVPHRAQKALLRERFPDMGRSNAIDTVERFQGGERDVIIVSATASDPDYVLAEADFLLNLNRLNVALSRPRKKLIVVAARSVIELLTSDLNVFENAVIWKRLYYQWAADTLWEGPRGGTHVTLRGRKAD